MISIDVLDFDWDDGNKEKCKKHGVTLDEIEEFFKQDGLYVAPDIKHSQQEQRLLAAGRSSIDKPMFVVFTMREIDGKALIRPVSARYMHEQEAKRYEKNT